MKYLRNKNNYYSQNKKLINAKELVPHVVWDFDDNSPIIGIGNNTLKQYNCWCPHNLQFDNIRKRFVFVQCHKSGHSGSTYISATMHIVHPEDPLKREDIAIPEIIGIANLLILDDGTYLLYPKISNLAKRYVSHDGGVTWNEETTNATNQNHFFGIYMCNGKYYAGCDYEWGEYHYSEDGLTWTTKTIGASETDYVNRTKEHSFCYWNGHVYAFGRRDWYDANNQLIADRNNCSIVYRLDGDTWTVVDDSHLLAFQSNCCPVAFEAGIAIAHINRVTIPSLYYTIYDGTSFKTWKEFDNLTKSGGTGDTTTPSLAFGNGYACIAFSTMPIISPLQDASYTYSINAMVVGTYAMKPFKRYFYGHDISLSNIAKVYNETPTKITIYPSEAESNVSWRWNANNYDDIINNNEYIIYYIRNEYPNLLHIGIQNDGTSRFTVYNGKFIGTEVLGGKKAGEVSKNWIMDYDNRHFAISGRGDEYTGNYSVVKRRYVLECDFYELSTQPDIDMSNVPNGAVVGLISANGGVTNTRSKTKGAYLTFA